MSNIRPCESQVLKAPYYHSVKEMLQLGFPQFHVNHSFEQNEWLQSLQLFQSCLADRQHTYSCLSGYPHQNT